MNAAQYTAQASEVVILLTALFLTPIMYVSFRDIRGAGKNAFAIAYAAMCASYVSTVAEGYALGPAMNFLEHLFGMVSGIAFAVGVWQLVVWARGTGDAG